MSDKFDKSLTTVRLQHFGLRVSYQFLPPEEPKWAKSGSSGRVRLTLFSMFPRDDIDGIDHSVSNAYKRFFKGFLQCKTSSSVWQVKSLPKPIDELLQPYASPPCHPDRLPIQQSYISTTALAIFSQS